MLNECTNCGLHRHRRQEVPSEGDTPADILFIGEAPGKGEDLRGKPFIGPGGRILKTAIKEAAKMADLTSPPSYHIANVVRCRPADKQNGPNRQPTAEEAWACWPYLRKVYEETKPQVVIFLGKVPEKFCRKAMRGGIYMYHPSYILRSGGKRSSQWREFLRQMSELFREIKPRRKKIGKRV
jgi:DNA polymerase